MVRPVSFILARSRRLDDPVGELVQHRDRVPDDARNELGAYAAFGRFPARAWQDAAPNYSPGGMVFAGDPEEIAERIIDMHDHLGHTRHFLQMDIGGMPTPRYSSPSNYSEPK